MPGTLAYGVATINTISNVLMPANNMQEHGLSHDIVALHPNDDNLPKLSCKTAASE